MNNYVEAQKCLIALGDAWRGDWSSFDGRTLRDQLDSICLVMDGKLTFLEFCEREWIDPETHCWIE